STGSRWTTGRAIETCARPIPSLRLLRRNAEPLYRRLPVRHDFEQLRETQNLEHLVDRRHNRAELDVAARFADVLHQAHEHAEPGGGDVGQSGAIHHQAHTSGVELILDRLFELRSGVSVQVAGHLENGDLAFLRTLDSK